MGLNYNNGDIFDESFFRCFDLFQRKNRERERERERERDGGGGVERDRFQDSLIIRCLCFRVWFSSINV